jgi:hypothetical protein
VVAVTRLIYFLAVGKTRNYENCYVAIVLPESLSQSSSLRTATPPYFRIDYFDKKTSKYDNSELSEEGFKRLSEQICKGFDSLLQM